MRRSICLSASNGDARPGRSCVHPRPYLVQLKKLIENKGVVFALLAVVIGGSLFFSLTPDTTSTLVNDVNDQIWIDADGNVFTHRLIAFDSKPVVGPTGKPAFRAELCYWTRDGKTKATPTPVLMNTNVGKPGPTFCPDCGHLVTALNAAPVDGVPDSEQRVPPTRSDYDQERRHSSTRP
jgi:hypothetical protein